MSVPRNPPINNDAAELTVSELQQLIAEKNKKRSIDCRIILDDFKGFLEQLEREKFSRPKDLPFRVQVLCHLEHSHNWSALDILVSHDEIHIFHLNAAGDSDNVDVITQVLTDFSLIKMTSCEGQLQRDWENCAVFALDHVFHMSKMMDLHEQVKKFHKPNPKVENKNMYTLDPFDLPAVLVKNMQSVPLLEKYIKQQANPQEKINKKGQTLKEYVDSHTIFRKALPFNTGITYKKKQYRLRLKNK